MKDVALTSSMLYLLKSCVVRFPVDLCSFDPCYVVLDLLTLNTHLLIMFSSNCAFVFASFFFLLLLFVCFIFFQ